MNDNLEVASFLISAPLVEVRAIRKAAKVLTRVGFSMEEAINLLLEKRNNRVPRAYAIPAR